MLRGDDADPAQQGEQHRQLEGEAEGEDQGHHEIEIFADLGLKLDAERAVAAFAFVADEKADGEGQHHIKHKGGPDGEQDRRCHQKGQEGVAFLPVKAGGNEHPDLRRDDRESEADARKHADFHIGEKGLVQRRIDEMGVGLALQRMRQWLGKKAIDRLGEAETDEKADRESGERPQQPFAQLDQVLHQRRLGRFDGRFVFGVWCGHGVSALTGGSGEVSACGSSVGGLAGEMPCSMG